MQILTRCLLLVITFLSSQTWAQSSSSFVSSVDQDLTIKKVTVVPFTDNLQGIYSKPLYKKFKGLVDADPLWSYQDFPEEPTTTLIDFEEDTNSAKAVLAKTSADGFFSFRITKGPRGLNGKLTFFAGKSGLPLIQEDLRDYPKFEISEVERQLEDMYTKIKSQLPYRGLILSRRGQEVTINIGHKNGLKKGDELTIIQLLQVNRHPKLKILVSSEKEIMGRVKVFKIDNNLSFAHIIFEREPGVIKVSSKVLPIEFVQYNEPIISADGKLIPGLENRKDRDLSYGDSPREWLPQEPPQYGRIALLAGLGAYSLSSNLSASGSIEGSTPLAPQIAAKGEVWISSEWAILFGLRQSIFSVANPLAGSNPKTLNISLASYQVLGGYNFLMSDDFFGPKIQLSAGYSTYNSHTDLSTPSTFTNMDYGGLLVGLAGQFPLSVEIPMDLGAQFTMFLSPGMSESPNTSSSAKSTINQFGFFGVYNLRSRFKIRGEINFEYYSTDFSGSGAHATNTTQKMTSLMGGIEYLF